MTETLFERYKEALRAGHVAVLRGRLEDAVVAYREAVSIARDRAVPWTALGGVHLRLGEPEAALAAYDAALAIAPGDDPSLVGRAQALVVLRRTAEAAAAYDGLADLRAVDGRPAEAVEAARRALAIESSEARRSRHASLVEELGRIAGQAAAEMARREAGRLEGGATADTLDAGAPLAAEETTPGPDPESFVAAAEEAFAQGDPRGAADAALAAARAYRAAGHDAAAFEACLQGIEAVPADVDLHLLLAELAIDRGWRGHAGDAYGNLVRLAELDGAAGRAAEIRAVAAAHLPDDARFTPT